MTNADPCGRFPIDRSTIALPHRRCRNLSTLVDVDSWLFLSTWPNSQWLPETTREPRIKESITTTISLSSFDQMWAQARLEELQSPAE